MRHARAVFPLLCSGGAAMRIHAFITAAEPADRPTQSSLLLQRAVTWHRVVSFFAHRASARCAPCDTPACRVLSSPVVAPPPCRPELRTEGAPMRIRTAAGLLLALLVAACVYNVREPRVESLHVPLAPCTTVASPVKAHLLDGSVVHFQSGVSFDRDTLRGPGNRFSVHSAVLVYHTVCRLPSDPDHARS
jgi:hypothetical protein